jgi:uncharacterized membrane protein YccC
MRRTPISPLAILATMSLVSAGLLGNNISPAHAQQKSQATNGLFYPTSSQRFFEQGQKQLDIEIQHLQQNTPAPPPILNISADVLQQQQTWLQQQETWLQRQEPGNPILQPTQSQ